MKKRKTDHLNLALESQTGIATNDNRFIYEPLFSSHIQNDIPQITIAGKKQRVPLWVSSMTGGAEYAGVINKNLARACNEYGLGMGLGSCRVLLENNRYLSHFDLRKYLGDKVPFFANLGISQIEKSIRTQTVQQVVDMVNRLKADGLIIHINPLQELLQPEGDVIEVPPIDTIHEFQRLAAIPLIVKEVGQGLGYESLKALLQLPLEAVEFGAYGGTNFARIELERSLPMKKKLFEPLAYVGNDAYSMMDWVNQIVESGEVNTKALIVSGGLKTYLDGYYFLQKSKLPAVYGHASAFLAYAREDYEQLSEFVSYQLKGLQTAYSYLRLNKNFRL
jgi:isopentenyl-diphosphate Delta-isomerase